MRVSNRFLYYDLVKNLERVTERLLRLNNQISSGKRIHRPSEDPMGMASVLIYRTELNAFEQFEKSIDLSRGWLSRMNAILLDTDNLLGRAIELATQQASATATADTREGAAEEIEEIKNMILGYANSKYGNKYMFGGTRTQTAPFLNVNASCWEDNVLTIASSPPGSPSTGDRYIDSDDDHIYEYDGSSWQDLGSPEDGTAVIVEDQNELYVYNNSSWISQYQGNASAFSIKIGKTDTVETSIPGNTLFRSPYGDVFLTLLRLEKALRDNDQEGIQQELSAIQDSEQILLNNLATIGARVNRLDHTKSVLQKSDVDTKERMSLIEDLDYAEAITSLENQQTIYQAALKSASMITQLSLVDYV